MEKLSTLISEKNFKSRYVIVCEMNEIVVNIAESLKKTELSTSKGHEEALKTLLEKAFQEKSKKRGMKGFMDNLRKYTKGFWEGLFVYYDHPLIPKTNNDLERFFHLAKQDYRRIVGNDNWGKYIQNHGEYSLFVYNYRNKSQQEMIQVLKEISNNLIQSVSKDYLDVNKTRVLRYRYNKDTSAYLKRLEDLCADLR